MMHCYEKTDLLVSDGNRKQRIGDEGAYEEKHGMVGREEKMKSKSKQITPVT